MDPEYCGNYPHIYKSIQAINAVVLLICLGSTTQIDGVGVLWFVTMLSLFVSTAATVLYSMDQHEKIFDTVTHGEFVYSAVLTVLCAISFWLSFGYARHVPKDGYSSGYIFFGVFMIFQTALYAIPTIVFYDLMNEEAANEYNDPTKRSALFPEVQTQAGYQTTTSTTTTTTTQQSPEQYV